MDREQRSNHCHSPSKATIRFPLPLSNPVPSQPPHCNGSLVAISRWTVKVLCAAFCEAHGVGGQEEEKAFGQILPCHPSPGWVPPSPRMNIVFISCDTCRG